MSQELSRRDFMKLLTAGTGSFVLAPWGLVPFPEGLDEGLAAQVGTFPREETLIVRILTGRVGTNAGSPSGCQRADADIFGQPARRARKYDEESPGAALISAGTVSEVGRGTTFTVRLPKDDVQQPT